MYLKLILVCDISECKGDLGRFYFVFLEISKDGEYWQLSDAQTQKVLTATVNCFEFASLKVHETAKYGNLQ